MVASAEDRILEGDNCSLYSEDLGLLDSDTEVIMVKKNGPQKKLSGGSKDKEKDRDKAQGQVKTVEESQGRKMTRTEAKRHADSKRASEVAHEALPLVRKTEEAGRGKAAANKLRLQQSERKEPIAGPSGEPDKISIGTICLLYTSDAADE